MFKLSLFQTVIFIFSNFCEKSFEKIRKRKMAQGRVPSPTVHRAIFNIGKIFYSVFIEMQMYGPRQGSKTLPWAICHIFLKALSICNNINTNLNKNFHTQLNYHSFKPLFLFQISAKSRLKKFEIEKWPKTGYLPL